MAQEIEDVPVMYIELTDQQDSGYRRDDTVGTPYEEKITFPGVEFIPNVGKRAEPILDKEGKETGRFSYVPIRYIKGCDIIDVPLQDKLGWKPNPIPQEDAIQILKGKSFLRREGDTALFDYLEKVFYNISAPNRSQRAKGLFKVVEITKQTEVLNEKDFMAADAVMYVRSLVLPQGKNTYKYREDKIDNILTILGLYGGDTYPDKINVLTHAAKNSPENFLRLVVKADDVTITEVTHAIELNVITINGNTIEYVDDKKVLANLSDVKGGKDKKIAAFAELLRTPELAQVYQEMKVKVEIAQEDSLK